MKHSDGRTFREHSANGPDAQRDSRGAPKRRLVQPEGAHGRAAAFAREAHALLTTRYVGHVMQAYKSVDSTNSLAAKWIEDGAPHGAVVVADFQRRGRGRHGRSWVAGAGLNLTFSVVLRLDLAPDRLGMLTIAGCLGAAASLDRFAEPLRTSIKWPNDIYLGGRKLCGMLLEANWGVAGRKPAVVLGIGLNVNQDEFPPELSETATSLLMETGRIIPRADLFAALLADLERALDRLTTDEAGVRRDYVRKMMSLDERIRFRFASNDHRIEGIVRGIDASGGILIESNAKHLVFHAGEVTPSA